jgi:hypothetical protein
MLSTFNKSKENKIMELQVEKKWQVSTKEERLLGREFIRHVFESLAIGSEVTETMLDLVVKELYDHWGFYVRNIDDEYWEALNSAFDGAEVSQDAEEEEEEKERIIQGITENIEKGVIRIPIRHGATGIISNKVGLRRWG